MIWSGRGGTGSGENRPSALFRGTNQFRRTTRLRIEELGPVGPKAGETTGNGISGAASEMAGLVARQA